MSFQSIQQAIFLYIDLVFCTSIDSFHFFIEWHTYLVVIYSISLQFQVTHYNLIKMVVIRKLGTSISLFVIEYETGSLFAD